MKCGTGKNTNSFFDVIYDDLWLELTNTLQTPGTVTLFDAVNMLTNGLGTRTVLTVSPSALFPVVNTTITKNGSVVTIGLPGVPQTAATLAVNLSAATGDAWTRTTTPAGEIFTASGINTYTNFTTTTIGITSAISSTSGTAIGTGITVSLVNMDYSQFVSGLPMMKGFYVDYVSIYANSLSQAVQSLFYSKFEDYAGTQVINNLNPWIQPFQQQFGVENLPVCVQLDGSNTLQYTVGPGEIVKIKLRAYANDVAHAIIDEPGVQPSISQGTVGGKGALFSSILDGTYKPERAMIPKDTIDEGDYGM